MKNTVSISATNPSFKCKFSESGIDYNSVTQYYYSKMSNDIMYVTKIMTSDDPDEIISFGNNYYKRFLSKDNFEPDEQRYKNMKEAWKHNQKPYYIWATYLKFKQNPGLLPCIKDSTENVFKNIFQKISEENK